MLEQIGEALLVQQRLAGRPGREARRAVGSSRTRALLSEACGRV
jgi:hypothetical protein